MTTLQGRCFRTETLNAAEHASPSLTRSLRHLSGQPTAMRVRREAGSPRRCQGDREGSGSGCRNPRCGRLRAKGRDRGWDSTTSGWGCGPEWAELRLQGARGSRPSCSPGCLPEELLANGRAVLPDRGREEAELSAQAGPCAVGLSPVTSAGGYCLVLLARGPVPARTGSSPLPWAGTHRCGAGSSGPLCALLLCLYVAPFGRSGMEHAPRPQRWTWTSCSCWTASPT